MNPRSIGRTLFVIGTIILICYIGWIVFRLVKQPEMVESNGLLPNPFTELLIKPKTEEETTEKTTEDLSKETKPLTEIPKDPEKKLFALVRENVVNYKLFTDKSSTVVQNPETGKTEEIYITIPRVRYASFGNGFITDTLLVGSKLQTKSISTTFIDGLQSISFGDTGYIGSYQSEDSKNQTFFIKSSETEKQPEPEKQSCPIEITTSIKKGETSRVVEYIQSIITDKTGFSDWVIGNYDETMQLAIANYQKEKKMKSTLGILDEPTVLALTNDCISLLPKIEIKEKPISQKISLLPGTIYKTSSRNNDSALIIKNIGTTNAVIEKSFVTNKEKTLLKLFFVDWNIFDTKAGIYWMTRASSSFPGAVFFTGEKTDTFTPVLTDISGLAISPNHAGTELVYSKSKEGSLPELIIYTTRTRETKETTINTFAEKCAWNKTDTMIYCFVPQDLPEATYPDEWYKRELSLTDVLYSIDPKTGQSTKIDQNNEFPAEHFDVIRPSITDDDQYIIFQDWNSHYIWGYRLK